MLVEKMLRALHPEPTVAKGVATDDVQELAPDDGAPLPLLGADRAMVFASAGGEIETDLILNLSAMTTTFVGYQH